MAKLYTDKLKKMSNKYKISSAMGVSQ